MAELEEFIEYLKGYYHSVETIECEFGDHYSCTSDDFVGYGFGEYIDHVLESFNNRATVAQ